MVFGFGLFYFAGILSYLLFSKILKVHRAMEIVEEAVFGSVAINSVVHDQLRKQLAAEETDKERISSIIEIQETMKFNAIIHYVPGSFRRANKWKTWNDLVLWHNKKENDYAKKVR